MKIVRARLKRFLPIGTMTKKLLIPIFLFSTLVTMVITLGEIYVEYNHGVKSIDNRLKSIKERELSPLAYALWTLNERQVEFIAKSMFHSPDISYVKIANPQTGLLFEYGDSSGKANRRLEQNIFHYVDEKNKYDVGTITLNASFSNLYSNLKTRVIVILLGQTIKTFAVTFFIMWIVGALVIRDLNSIASFLAGLQFPRDTGKTYQKRQNKIRDEIDVVIDRFNEMTVRLDNSYTQINLWNDGLEDIVAQRMVDIRRLQEKNAHLIRVLCHDIANSSMSISLIEYKFRRLLPSVNLKEEHLDQLGNLMETLRANITRQQEILKQVREAVLATDSESILVDLKKVNVSQLFEEVVQNFQEQIVEKEISVNQNIQGSTSGFQVDYSVFKNNILSNLLSNAIKYSNKGGVVDLKFRSGSSWQYISITNYGRLISEDEIKSIKASARIPSSPGTNGEEGSGLGLQIVQRCLRAHDGSLEILRGSDDIPYAEFRIHIPVRPYRPIEMTS